MEENGVSRAALARRSGVGKQHVSEWLNNPPKNMKLESMLTLEEALERLLVERAHGIETEPCES